MATAFLKSVVSTASKAAKAVGLAAGGPPPDEKLTRALTRLNALEKVISNMTQAFKRYAASVNASTACGVGLSNDITRFYQDNAPRLSSVKKFGEAHAKIESAANALFDRDFSFDLIPIFADWTPEVQRIKKQIAETDRARIQLYEIKIKTEELRADHKRRSDKGTASLEQATQLQRQEEELKKYQSAYEVMFENAEKATKEIMDGRFAAFDQCYVRLLELQLEYAKHAQSALAPLQSAVENYRKRHPKTGYSGAVSPTNAGDSKQKTPPTSNAQSKQAPGAAELSDDDEAPKAQRGGEGPNGTSGGSGKAAKKPARPTVDPAVQAAAEAEAKAAKEKADADAAAAKAAAQAAAAAAEAERKRREANAKQAASVFGALEGFDAMAGGGAEKPDPLAAMGGGVGGGDDDLSSLAGFAPRPKPLSKPQSFDMFDTPAPAQAAANKQPAAATAPAASASSQSNDFGMFFGAAAPTSAPAAASKPPAQSQSVTGSSASNMFDFSGGATTRPTATAAPSSNRSAPVSASKSPAGSAGFGFDGFDVAFGGGSAPTSVSRAASSSSRPTVASSSSGSGSGGGAEDPDMFLPGELDGPPSSSSIAAAAAAASADPLDDIDDKPPPARAPASVKKPAAPRAHDPDDFTSHLSNAGHVENTARSNAADVIADMEANAAATRIRNEQKNQVSDALKATLQNWEYKNSVQKSIRTLLSTMHQVLWVGHSWTPLGLAEVMDDKKLHKYVNKARLVVHPDKQPADASAERLYTAERINEALSTAWAAFDKNKK